LEQNEFNITLKSFDDNKVLKFLRSLIGSGRTKERKKINKKEV